MRSLDLLDVAGDSVIEYSGSTLKVTLFVDSNLSCSLIRPKYSLEKNWQQKKT